MSEAAQNSPLPNATIQQSDRRERLTTTLPSVILVLVVLLTFCQAFRYDFINLDDRDNDSQNALLNPPTWHSLRVWWTRPNFEMYNPVMSTIQGGVALLARVSPDPETGDARTPGCFTRSISSSTLA